MIRRFFIFTLTLAILSQIFVSLANESFFFELFTHYKVYYALLSCLLVAAMIPARMWKSALIMLVILSINLAAIAPYIKLTNSPCLTCKFLPREEFQPANMQNAPVNVTDTLSTLPALSILSSNFFYRNTEFEEFRDLINAENPDIFMIHEASSLWLTEADYYDNTYPYYSRTEELGIPGIFMFSTITGSYREVQLGSKYALEFTPELSLPEAEMGEHKLKILAVHPPAPITSSYAAERNAQLEDLAEYATETEAQGYELVVMGDFNSTPFSPYFETLMAESGLADARISAINTSGLTALVPSWHAQQPWFSLPIDHALISNGLNVQSFQTTEKISADHLPILVKLAFP